MKNLEIWLETLSNEVISITARYPSTYAMLCSHSSVLADYGLLWMDEVENDGVITATGSVRGYFACGAVSSWLRQTSRYAGSIRKRLEDRKGDSIPVPLVIHVNGQLVTQDQADDILQGESIEVQLGEFKLGDEMRVTDPCYRDKSDAVFFDCLPGIWKASSVIGPTDWLRRNVQLRVWHESVDPLILTDLSKLNRSEELAGVDSGQCGFFDAKLYPKAKIEFENEAKDGAPTTFYARVVAVTLPEYEIDWNKPVDLMTLPLDPQSGIVGNMGAVSMSGQGDGAYAIYYEVNEAHQVIAAVLVFCNDPYHDSEHED